jgi:hypothetical protein
MSEVEKRFVRRMKIAIRWQWRMGVFRREIAGYFALVGIVAGAVAVAIVGAATVCVWPAVIAWRFTGGMVWAIMKAKESELGELEEAMKGGVE